MFFGYWVNDGCNALSVQIQFIEILCAKMPKINQIKSILRLEFNALSTDAPNAYLLTPVVQRDDRNHLEP